MKASEKFKSMFKSKQNKDSNSSDSNGKAASSQNPDEKDSFSKYVSSDSYFGSSDEKAKEKNPKLTKEEKKKQKQQEKLKKELEKTEKIIKKEDKKDEKAKTKRIKEKRKEERDRKYKKKKKKKDEDPFDYINMPLMDDSEDDISLVFNGIVERLLDEAFRVPDGRLTECFERNIQGFNRTDNPLSVDTAEDILKSLLEEAISHRFKLNELIADSFEKGDITKGPFREFDHVAAVQNKREERFAASRYCEEEYEKEREKYKANFEDDIEDD